jgi:hypothetical protein
MDVSAADEFAATEITILPDGRVCLFGASRQVLELLRDVGLGDPMLDRRLAALEATDEVADVDCQSCRANRQSSGTDCQSAPRAPETNELRRDVNA